MKLLSLLFLLSSTRLNAAESSCISLESTYGEDSATCDGDSFQLAKDSLPIEITDQTGTTVSFTVSQDFINSTVSRFAVHYNTSLTDVDCAVTNDADVDFTSEEYTATCISGVADVKVHLYLCGNNGEEDYCQRPSDDTNDYYEISFILDCSEDCAGTEDPTSGPTPGPTEFCSNRVECATNKIYVCINDVTELCVSENAVDTGSMAELESAYCGRCPTASPTETPTTSGPTVSPTMVSSEVPSDSPSLVPSALSSDVPSDQPSLVPSALSSEVPSDQPSLVPSALSSEIPSDAPSLVPTALSSEIPSDAPSLVPTALSSVSPTSGPTSGPTDVPSASPSSCLQGAKEYLESTFGDGATNCDGDLLSLDNETLPIQITDQTDDGSSVSFMITQGFIDSTVSKMAVHYHTALTDVECAVESDVAMDWTSEEYTATCFNGVADVKVYLYLCGNAQDEDCDYCQRPTDGSEDYLELSFTLDCTDDCPGTTMAPTPCPYEIDPLPEDEQSCPDGDEILTYQPNTFNDEPNSTVIHSISFDDDEHTVSFKVANPYGDDSHDIYVLYDHENEYDMSGDAICEGEQDRTSCPSQTTFTAKCLSYLGIYEYAVVTVYAVGTGAQDSIFPDSTSASLHECCPLDGDERNPDDGLAAWTYVINCCPSDESVQAARRGRRKLRGDSQFNHPRHRLASEKEL